MSEVDSKESADEGLHESCHNAESCCEDQCGPVFRDETETGESVASNGEVNGKVGMNGAKFILREITTGSPFMVPGGPSSNYYFVPKKKKMPETEQ